MVASPLAEAENARLRKEAAAAAAKIEQQEFQIQAAANMIAEMKAKMKASDEAPSDSMGVKAMFQEEGDK